MTRVRELAWTIRIWKDTRGQDFIEYALLAGFVAAAGASIMPGPAAQIVNLLSKVNSALRVAEQSSGS